MHEPFAGRGVLITGASRGLGRALYEQLASHGARVVGSARELGPLQLAANELRERGFEAHALQADMGDAQAIYPLAGAAQALVGPIDLLIHNASTLGPTPLRTLLDTEPDDISQVLAVNLLGPLRLTQAIAGGMLVRQRGTVVFISSDAAVNAYPNWGAYGVSKAALDHASRSWAVELGGSGVTVVSVDPGEMDTQMHRSAVPDADPATLAQPRDVAASILTWLASLRPEDSGRRVAISEWRPR